MRACVHLQGAIGDRRSVKIPVERTQRSIQLKAWWPVQVLEELVHLHEVPRLMQEFRTLDKIHSDFVIPLDRRARRSSFGSPSTVRF